MEQDVLICMGQTRIRTAVLEVGDKWWHWWEQCNKTQLCWDRCHNSVGGKFDVLYGYLTRFTTTKTPTTLSLYGSAKGTRSPLWYWIRTVNTMASPLNLSCYGPHVWQQWRCLLTSRLSVHPLHHNKVLGIYINYIDSPPLLILHLHIFPICLIIALQSVPAVRVMFAFTPGTHSATVQHSHCF